MYPGEGAANLSRVRRSDSVGALATSQIGTVQLTRLVRAETHRDTSNTTIIRIELASTYWLIVIDYVLENNEVQDLMETIDTAHRADGAPGPTAVPRASASEVAPARAPDRTVPASDDESEGMAARLCQLTERFTDAWTVSEVCEAAVTTVRSELSAEFAAAWLLDPDGHHLRLAYRDGHDPGEGTPPQPLVAADRSLHGWALRREELVEWGNAAERRPWVGGAPDGGEPPTACLIAPLVVAGEGLGVLEVGYADGQQIDGHHRGLVRLLADQCAQALRRAQLHDRLAAERDRALVQSGVGEVLVASLDESSMLQRVAEMVGPSLAGGCAVALTDDDGELRPVAVAHRDPVKRALFERLVLRNRPVRNPYLKKVAETGESLVLTDLDDDVLDEVAQDDDHRALLHAFGVAAAIIVPLRTNEHVVGVLMVFDTDDGERLTEEDLPSLESIGGQTAAALSNARAHRREQELSGQLQQALDSRVAIEQAKGVLAERHAIDTDAAFERLRTAARHRGERIHDLAQAVVAERLDV